MPKIKIYVYDNGKPVETVEKTDATEANTFINEKIQAGYKVNSSWEK
jgi:hypothetical protein